MSNWATDALWLAPLICARLREQLPALREAIPVDELEPGQNEPAQDPAAVVMLDALRPPGADPNRPQALVEQDWLVVLVVRTARRDRDGARQKLGPLISQAVRALHGWVPPGTHRPLAWRAGPRPDYGRTSSLFPLRFTVAMTANQPAAPA